MKILVYGLASAAVFLLGAAFWVRTAADDPARWHVDPAAGARTGKPNDALRGPVPNADGPAPVWAATPAEALQAFERIALGAPRTLRLAGSPEDGLVTYVQRSAVMRFPDYISVRAIPTEGGATLAVWSRSRYGHSDLGVNAARLDAWIAAVHLPRAD